MDPLLIEAANMLEKLVIHGLGSGTEERADAADRLENEANDLIRRINRKR